MNLSDIIDKYSLIVIIQILHFLIADKLKRLDSGGFHEPVLNLMSDAYKN